MCEPSTSASVMMIILWYRAFSPSKADSSSPAPMPVPIAVMRVRISSLLRTLSSWAFYAVDQLAAEAEGWPGNDGRGPCLAEPPAESPSTM